MEIADVASLAQLHADGAIGEDAIEMEPTRPLPDTADAGADQSAASPQKSEFPWMRAEPFSPVTRGVPLPYLDVMSVQSKRLLPTTRKELDAQRRLLHAHEKRQHQNKSPAVDGDDGDSASDEDDDERKEPANSPDATAALDLDALVRSVRLLLEPVVLPDLTHTGVAWQRAGVRARDAPAFCVTQPNHTAEETQPKLFYATGAKSTTMREYIQDTIQRHMAGLLPKAPSDGDGDGACGPTLAASQSVPALVDGYSEATTAPKKKGAKKTKSPTKRSPSSPQRKAPSAGASGARLSGAVSTSGLLNPELTRQAKGILAQLRANSSKINDLIGS